MSNCWNTARHLTWTNFNQVIDEDANYSDIDI